MNIADQKREILGLIAKLHRPSSGGSLQLATRIHDPQLSAALLQNRLVQRRRDLAEIVARREQTAADLLEERLLKICQDLDSRISRIEAVIKEQGGRFRGEVSSDDVNAPDLSDMTPEIGISAGARGAGHSPPKGLSKGRQPKESSLGGVIDRATLPDILQMVSSNAMNGVFVLEGAGKSISLFMKDGEMFHAVTDGMEGQSAFFAAMAMEEGRFNFYETKDLPNEKTIDGNTQFLILEALRQIDEEQQGES